MLITTTRVLAVCAAILTGCVQTPGDDDRFATRSNEVDQPPMADKDIPPNPVQLPATILAPAVADLVRRTGADERDIVVRRALPVVWNDGAVGCPKPGMAYTQALVPGYWALLEHDGRYYSYHAAGRGPFRLCERARLGPHDAPPHGRYNDAV